MTTRPRRSLNPALQALLDAPLKLDVSPPVQERIEALRAEVRGAGPDVDAVALYGRAIETAEALLGDMDARLSEMEQRALSNTDPAEIKHREFGKKQRAAADLQARIKTDLAKVVTEWEDRLRRQQDQVNRQCLDLLDADFSVGVTADKRQVTVAVTDGAWASVRSFLDDCLAAWSSQACAGANDQLAKVLEVRNEAHGATRVPWRPPSPSPPPAVDLSPLRRPAPGHGDAPTTLGALGGFLRSNVLMVSMFGMMVGAPIAMVFGLDVGRGRSGMMRALVVGVALPFLVAIGYRTGVTKRRSAIDKLTTDYNQRLRDGTQKVIRSTLEAHRQTTLRWVRARSTELEQSLGEWWEIAVHTALRETEKKASEMAHRARIDHKKLADQHARLKRSREDCEAKLLFELRRHHRDLREAAGG